MIPARFKSSKFKVRSETLNEVGQSYIDHRYPKSRIQYEEPMGQNPFNCTMEIFFSGDSYIEDFESFQTDISDPAPGRLFVPTFELIIESMVCKPADFKIVQTAIGEITASVTFSESIPKPAPKKSSSTVQDVSQAAQAVLSATKVEFEKSYEEPKKIDNIKTVEEDGLVAIQKISELAGGVREEAEFIRKLPTAIKDPAKYGELLLGTKGVLQTLSESFDTIESLDFWKNISFIGFDASNSMNDIRSGVYPTKPPFISVREITEFIIPSWPEDTKERIDRNINRFAFYNTCRITALTNMYEISARSDFFTTEEVDEVTETLNTTYTELIEEDTTNVVIPEVKKGIENLKAVTEETLQQKRQQAYGTTTVFRTRPVSSQNLSYQLYGEYLKNQGQLQFFSNTIAGLNRGQTANALVGEIKVVSIG